MLDSFLNTFSQFATLTRGEQTPAPPPAEGLTPDDLQSFNEETFYFFEKDFLLVTNACNEFYHSVRGRSAEEVSNYEEDPEESSYVIVKAQMEDIMRGCGPGENSSGVSDDEDEGISAVSKANNHESDKTDTIEWIEIGLEFMHEKGTPSTEFKAGLKQRQLSNRREDVNNWTSLNKGIRSFLNKKYPSKTRQALPAAPTTPWGLGSSLSHADTLFSRLSETLCSSCKTQDRSAHLRLAGWSNSQDQATFHMFLPCCSMGGNPLENQDHHSAVCKVDGKRLPLNDSPLDLCREIQACREDQIELHLAFFRSHLWPINPLPPANKLIQPADRVSLHDLLENRKAGSENFGDNKLKSSRLAFNLASSLHYLCLGPWVQDHWTAANIHIFGDNSMFKWDNLYVSCTFGPKSGSANAITESFKDCSYGNKPAFLVSFAQLLLYIAKGEAGYSGHVDKDPSKIIASLRQEVQGILKKSELAAYGSAIIGCLTYATCLRNKLRMEADVNKCVRQVIHQSIVVPLRENLDNWEGGWQNDKSGGTDSGRTFGSLKPKSSAQIQKKKGSQKIERPSIASEYRLFANEDDQSSAWTNDMNARDKDFTWCMRKFLASYINRPHEEQEDPKRVRIAILDTGFRQGNDYQLEAAVEAGRVVLQKDFTSNSEDCDDYHGHGTHVARLVLQFAPEAEIYIAKVSKSQSLEHTKIDQLAQVRGGVVSSPQLQQVMGTDEHLEQALKWAGENADIINLSFGLGPRCPPAKDGPSLAGLLDVLIDKKKLIFAAASNSGANGSRSWPGSHNGIFCIHATDEQSKSLEMNPIAGPQDNFATLGDKIHSQWAGEDVCISGTSFATPMAAAIAANVVEYVRCHFSDADPEMFLHYGTMRRFFREHMCENGEGICQYHYLKPWREGLWEENADEEALIRKLKRIAIGQE